MTADDPTLWDDQPGWPTGSNPLDDLLRVAEAYRDQYLRDLADPPRPAFHVGEQVHQFLTEHRADYEREAMARFGYVPELHLVPAPRETPQLCTWCTNPTLAAARDVCEATRCPFATDTYLGNPAPPSPDGSMCTFPGCDCAGDEPVCDDYLTTNGTRRLMRLRADEPCPVHHLPEPCPTCVDVVGMPF